MSVGVKITHHPEILKKKAYQLGGGQQFAKLLVASPNGLADTKMIGNNHAQCSVDFLAEKGVDFVRVNPKPLKAHRCLPFEEDTITYLTLDNAAQLVLTGPLTGCHIYVAQGGGSTTIMHVNWNKTATDTAAGKLANSNKKLQLATSLAAVLPGAPPITNQLVYNPTANHKDYFGYLAFVVGSRKTTTSPWVFHVCGMAGPKDTIFKQF